MLEPSDLVLYRCAPQRHDDDHSERASERDLSALISVLDDVQIKKKRFKNVVDRERALR